jgi:hypothetical protein
MNNIQTLQQLQAFLETAPAEQLTDFIEKLCLERPDLRQPLVNALRKLPVTQADC